MAGIGFFVDDHTRVGTEFPSELTVTDIHRVNPCGTTGEQYIGKTPSRCTNIEADESAGVEPENLQCVTELQPAAGNPRMGLTPNL